jgi:lactate permease
VGIIVFKFPTKWAALATMIYCIVLVIFYAFGKGSNPDAKALTFGTAWMQAWGGIKSGASVVFMIWSAFLTMNMLVSSGAMGKIKEIISAVTPDRRKLAIIIGLCFGGFLEGVAGAGTPAAICAPFFLALGFPILDAAAIPLVFNGIAASLGAVGLTTHYGFSAFVDLATTDPSYVDVLNVGLVTGFVHTFGAVASSLLVSRFFFGKKALTGEHVVFCIITGLVYGAVLIIMGALVGPEFPTMFAGLISLVVSVALSKASKAPVPEEFKLAASASDQSLPASMTPFKAVSTYVIMIVVLLAIRLPGNYNAAWLAFLMKLGFAVWIGLAITITALIGAAVNQETGKMVSHAFGAFKSVIGALFAISCLTAVSNMMKAAGMMQIIATTLVTVTGPGYPAAAVLIGTLGSFVMGTTMGSNIMFGPIHFPSAHLLGIPQAVVFAANSTGGALGNMICPNNVVSCCATVNYKEEGKVMTRVIPIIVILWALYMVLALLNSYVFFNWLPVK